MTAHLRCGLPIATRPSPPVPDTRHSTLFPYGTAVTFVMTAVASVLVAPLHTPMPM